MKEIERTPSSPLHLHKSGLWGVRDFAYISRGRIWIDERFDPNEDNISPQLDLNTSQDDLNRLLPVAVLPELFSTESLQQLAESVGNSNTLRSLALKIYYYPCMNSHGVYGRKLYPWALFAVPNYRGWQIDAIAPLLISNDHSLFVHSPDKTFMERLLCIGDMFRFMASQYNAYMFQTVWLRPESYTKQFLSGSTPDWKLEASVDLSFSRESEDMAVYVPKATAFTIFRGYIPRPLGLTPPAYRMLKSTIDGKPNPFFWDLISVANTSSVINFERERAKVTDGAQRSDRLKKFFRLMCVSDGFWKPEATRESAEL